MKDESAPEFPPVIEPPLTRQPTNNNKTIWLLLTIFVFVPLGAGASLLIFMMLFCGGCTITGGTILKNGLEDYSESKQRADEAVRKAQEQLEKPATTFPPKVEREEPFDFKEFRRQRLEERRSNKDGTR